MTRSQQHQQCIHLASCQRNVLSANWFVSKMSSYHMLTWSGAIFPGHQAIAGSRIPPSNVVCLPHRNGPLLPPTKCIIDISWIHISIQNVTKCSIQQLAALHWSVIQTVNICQNHYQQANICPYSEVPLLGHIGRKWNCLVHTHVHTWRLGLVVTALHTSTKLPYVAPG